MNPLLIARNLGDDYLTLLRSTFRPRQQDLKEAFYAEIEKDGFLTREPFISLAQPYKVGEALVELDPATRQRFGAICDTPYQHQADACRRIMNGQPTVVATGTGSGKTEAFLMPIIDHCIRSNQPGKSSLKAILIYPMNALANDQCNRIRKLLEGTTVSFGRYTRETKMMGQRPADAPSNERILRPEFRQSPPDLLLTNYMMLEYMLMRGDGRDIFKDHQVRFMVLDEVHTYHGTLGTDVACLMRRLCDALRIGNPAAKPLFVGTSATLQAGEEGDPKVGVAAFFSQLTGQTTPPDGVIMEQVDPPPMPTGLSLPPPPELSDEELAGFDAKKPTHVGGLVRKLAGATSLMSSVEQVWTSSALPYLLMDWLRKPMSEQAVIDLLGKRPERAGVDQAALTREVEAALLVGPCVDGSPVKLRPRVHRFLRGLARFWRCTNPDCGKLLGQEISECDACSSRALPLALCRTCGWDFFMARHGSGGVVEPWPYPKSGQQTLFLYDPPKERIAVDAEEDLSGDESEGNGSAPTASDAKAAIATQDGTDEPVAHEHLSQPDFYLDPKTLRLEAQPADAETVRRPVALHQGKGTRCPVCESRFGRFDVITPVTLGNSSALTHVSRMVMRDLPAGERKMLIFCDSRQDAAHQAMFIRDAEDRRRMRRLIYQLLKDEAEPHDFTWLVDRLYAMLVSEGEMKKTPNKDQQRRDKQKIEGRLLTEFAIAPRVRAGLERMGIVKVRYAGLDEILGSDKFVGLCHQHGLVPELAAYAVEAILDDIRQGRALNHQALKTTMWRGEELPQAFGIQVGPYIGKPLAFVDPGRSSFSGPTYALRATWNSKGNRASVQRLWMQFNGQTATQVSLHDVMKLLAGENGGYLVEETIGKKGDTGHGYQVSLDHLTFEAGKTFHRCSVCDRIASNVKKPGQPCRRTGCKGTMLPWAGPFAEGNLNALSLAEDFAPALYAEEHSAAVTDEKRDEIETGFKEKSPPRPNILACTPTLEMGVNIGDLEAVAMRNVPPSPANYAQRAGRSGRVSRMGITAGFSRNSPHDGYFFDHPDEIIAGAIPPPKFNVDNKEAIRRHLGSLILEKAAVDFPGNLETLLEEKGQVIHEPVAELVEKLKAAAPAAREAATRLWPVLAGDLKGLLEDVVQEFPEAVRATLKLRGELIGKAAEQMETLGAKVNLSPKEEQAHKGFRLLAQRLRTDHKYAYLPRVLAEAGLLPGYSFPSDPGSVTLGYDPEPLFGSRLQVQREYAPGQTVYARGKRWQVTGVALHRPGSSQSPDQAYFGFTLCGDCGLANDPQNNKCARCGAAIGGPDGDGLETFTAWDAAAFQAHEVDAGAEAEEERLQLSQDIRPHPQRNVGGQRFQVGPWALELRSQEEIWFINHGLKEVGRAAEQRADSEGFRLCTVCGDHLPLTTEESAPPKGKPKKPKEDPRLASHAKRCAGTFKQYSLGHKAAADTLRLVVPGIRDRRDEGVNWAWSFVYAMIQGVVRLFEVDEDDLEAYVLTKTVKSQDGQRWDEVLDVLWIDRVVGGSGILRRLAENFPAVAAAAVNHLDGHDCPNSCYRCLRSYSNQRVHRKLDWRYVLPFLQAATADQVVAAGDAAEAVVSLTDGPEWDEARAQGCESPQELRLLKAIRAEGSLPEPIKQYELILNGRILTRADFAFTDCQPHVLVYVDGLYWHSTLRQRALDNRITNKLLDLGFQVRRFLGCEVQKHPGRCVAAIVSARSKGT